MFCSNCGKQLPNDARHCASCGVFAGNVVSAGIQAVQFHCNSCNSVMHISSESQILRCPCCGSTELIVENDAVTIERIKSRASLEKHRSNTEVEREKLHIEDRKDQRKYRWEWKKTLLIILSPVICITALALAFRVVDFIDDFTDENLSIKVSPPLSEYRCDEEYYADLMMYFMDAGFTNVEAKSVAGSVGEDIIPGRVIKVMINGDTSFYSSDKFNPDVKVVIYYNSIE